MSRSRSKTLNKLAFFNKLWFFVFGLLIPSQLGKHFWPNFAFINGVRVDYLSPTIYLTDILLVVGTLTLIGKIKMKKITQFIPIILLLLLFFCFYLLRAPIKQLFLYRLVQYLKIALVALIFRVSTASEKRFFLKGLVATCIYTLVLALLQIWQQGSLQGLWWFLGERAFTINSPGVSTVSVFGQKIIRPYATFSHPNSLAGFFLVVFFLFRLSQLGWLSILPATLVIASLSKISITIMIILFLFQELKKNTSCRICKLAKILLGLWLVYFSLLFKGSPNSLTERVISWLTAINTIFKNPLGATPGHYLQSPPLSTPQPIHNVFLLLITEYGILAVVPFLLFYKNLIKTLAHKKTILFTVILTTGFFDHYWLTLQQNMLLLGVVMAIILTPLTKAQTLR